MRSFFRHIVEGLLFIRARTVLKRVDTIIGVTGSVGKTSTRMAIAHILDGDYTVQTSKKNFNTPIGLLLSILNIHQTGSSPFSWFGILLRAYCKRLPAPQVLVLEYGIDAPGDMAELTAICVPDILVVTPIAIGHMGGKQFRDIDEIRAEEFKLVKKAETVILNGFDKESITAYEAERPLDQQMLIYAPKAAGNVTVTYMGTGKNGITFLVDGEAYHVPVFGEFQVQVFAPGIILGNRLGIPLERIRARLEQFEPPPGRGRLFAGVNESTVWDFSYNSSPLATREVLRTLADIRWSKRRIALLGTMNELGDLALQEHERLGAFAADCADELVFVGRHADGFARGVAACKPLHLFSTAVEAGKYLAKHVREGDFILAKGSQNGVFLEVAVELLLAEPSDIEKLCRREKYGYANRNK